MAKQTKRVATADSYDNFVARVGMQQPNQHAASTYKANYTSRTGAKMTTVIIPLGRGMTPG